MVGTTFVTGATGFLGGALVRRLNAMGVPVIAQGRDPDRLAALSAQGIPTLAQDLSQPASRETLDALRDVSTIIHCAARSAPHGPARAFTLANVTATGHLLDTAKALGIDRFLFISSSSVSFAPTDQLGVRESDPLPTPFNAYARSKQQAEALVLNRFPTATILRPRGIYGAGDTALLPRLLRAARRGPLPLLRNGQGRIDLTHVEDVVDAILASLNASPAAHGQVYNVSGGEVLSITEIVTKACARSGLTPHWRPVPLTPLKAVSAMLETIFTFLPGDREPPVTRYGLALFAYAQSLDLTKARRDLDWQPRISFDQGLDLTFANGPPA